MSRRSSSDTSRRADRRPDDTGVMIMALMASVAIIMIGFMVAMPSWSYAIQREKEEELIYNAFEIVKGIRAWQKAQGGGGLPTSLKQMVEARHLRKEYADPFATRQQAKAGGGWFYVSPAQPRPECTPLNQPGAPGEPPPTNLNPPPPPSRSAPDGSKVQRMVDPTRVAQAGLLMGFFGAAQEPVQMAQDVPQEGQNIGGPAGDGQPTSGFSGVMSRSRKESYAVFNTKNRYRQWCFSLDTIPENLYRLDHVAYVLMKFPKERAPKFTGEGKKDPDRSKKRMKGEREFDVMPADPDAPPDEAQ